MRRKKEAQEGRQSHFNLTAVQDPSFPRSMSPRRWGAGVPGVSRQRLVAGRNESYNAIALRKKALL